MSLFRITHIDEHRTRRCLRVPAANREQAIAHVEYVYGAGWWTCVIKLEGGAA